MVIENFGDPHQIHIISLVRDRLRSDVDDLVLLIIDPSEAIFDILSESRILGLQQSVSRCSVEVLRSRDGMIQQDILATEA